jgi:hypothetical protein
MSYTKETGIVCSSGETVVRLDSGVLVAVQCAMARNPDRNTVEFMPSARWIDDADATQRDSAGRNVATVKTLSMAPDDVARLTPEAIVRECLYLVLGEPLTADPSTPETTLIAWSSDVVAQCSIRNAIASASVVTPTASEVL